MDFTFAQHSEGTSAAQDHVPTGSCSEEISAPFRITLHTFSHVPSHFQLRILPVMNITGFR
jgi:hypothetical protein